MKRQYARVESSIEINNKKILNRTNFYTKDEAIEQLKCAMCSKLVLNGVECKDCEENYC